jgi:hypothetical protein
MQMEQEIKRLVGLNFKNKTNKTVQTDLDSEFVKPAPSDPEYSDPKTIIKKLKEELL